MICAIQDQAITTKYIQRKIHRTTNENQCRLCHKATETIHHITSGCVAIALTKYLQRHDNVCKYVHDLLLNEFNFKDMPTTWYLHKPRAVEEKENAKILWNFSVQTDHAMQRNKPDIIAIDKAKNSLHHRCSRPKTTTTSVETVLTRRIRAYTDLAVDVETLWRLSNVEIVPINGY